MTDTTAARRALLALLLDRVERGALLPAEAPLIRPLVLAEQGNADRAADYDNRLTWETTCGEHARLLDACRAADERAEQAAADARPATAGRRYWRGSDGDDIADAYMTAQAAIARVRALLPRIERVATTSGPGPASAVRAVADWLRAALDGPSEPQCRDVEGCHSVIPCDPGCAGRESRLNRAFTPPRDAPSEPQS